MDELELLRRLLWPLILTSVVASMAGVSLMLRDQESIRARDVVSTILASIAASAIVLLLLSDYLGETPYVLYGVSSLAGAGGSSTLELVFKIAKRQLAKRGWIDGEPDVAPGSAEEDA